MKLLAHNVGGRWAAVALLGTTLGWSGVGRADDVSATQPPPTENEPSPSDASTPADDVPEDGEPSDASTPADDVPEDGEPSAPPDPYDVSVFGESRERRATGAAYAIDEEELERFEDDNVHRTLLRVPGVYVRGEDGFGLRPNIGLRGANSDRSAKVNLLEDGILLGPAPYSAPAAYYFPLITRMTGVEVFKGASAIRHGPNTIGGTINFATRPIPYRHKFGADLALGSNFYGKAHGYYGYGGDHWGVLVEGVRLRSDGFKTLDTASGPFGDRTGFDKTEVMVKARVNTDPADDLYNQGSIKLTYSREVSNETYLGLTDADFAVDPLRRYAGSAVDRMEWNRYAIEASHDLIYQEGLRRVLTLRTTAYRHDFSRGWNKLNGFDSQIPIGDVLADPTSGRAVLYGVLTGAVDSASSQETLLIGLNDRTFVSQGIQTAAAWQLPDLGPVQNRLQLGLRLHHDSIDRLHTSDAYIMRNGLPQRTTAPREVTTDNMGSTIALAGYAVDEVVVGPLLFTPGIRFEYITNTFENSLTGEIIEGVQQAFLPGIGALFQPIDELAILGGVHQGFSPVTPGQPVGVQQETAVNYEFGARFAGRYVNAEVIRFISDYDNLTGVCTFSAGCDDNQIDDQFNAGEARITGLEATARAEVPTPLEDLSFPAEVSYTFTRTLLLEEFESSNPQLGEVEVGDELPYVPPHQVSATLGLASKRWGGFNIGFTFVDSMREVAGSGTPGPGEATDSFFVIDLGASVRIVDALSVYGKVENLLDNRYIVSRRPFGARPGRPFFIFGGVKIEIDRG